MALFNWRGSNVHSIFLSALHLKRISNLEEIRKCHHVAISSILPFILFILGLDSSFFPMTPDNLENKRMMHREYKYFKMIFP